MKLSPLAPPVHRRAMRAFTLIELLVVVAIIALLAGLAVGGYGKIMNSVKANAGKKLAVELANAVTSYYATYDTLPVTGVSGGDANLNTLEDTDFLAVLAAKGDVKMNSRKLDFLDGIQQAKIKGDGSVENGVDFTDPAAPKMYDPWGQEYIVIMDTDFDGEIENPLTSDAVKIIRGKKCIIYSTGRPSSNGTKNSVESEYLKSW